MVMDFHDRNVLVTGAGVGIGRSITLAFLQMGARVMLNARRLDSLKETLSLAKGLRDQKAELFAADIRSQKAVEEMVEETVRKFGSIDILVNNAGIYPNKLVVDMDTEEWDAVLDTNLRAPFLICRAVAREMISRGQGGKIINITSGVHRSARKGAAHYASSKAALTMFTKVLALELAEHGINVNAVSPGLIDVGPHMPVTQEYKDSLVKMIPWQRMGRPEEIAKVVLFIASDDAEYVTGESFEVDGGAGAGRFYLPLSDPRKTDS
jgi:3-oxoacyl-[acyl-carrier protein] reductase